MLKYLRQLKRNEENGATMIEAAMVLPFVLFFLFVAIDLFLFAYQAVAVQFVVTNLMREVATSESISLRNVLAETEQSSDELFLKFGPPAQGEYSRVCLCPLTEAATPRRCLDSSMMCRKVGGPVPGRQVSVGPGESFFLAISYPVPQLFSVFLPGKKFRVEAVSIGRVEPRGVA